MGLTVEPPVSLHPKCHIGEPCGRLREVVAYERWSLTRVVATGGSTVYNSH